MNPWLLLLSLSGIALTLAVPAIIVIATLRDEDWRGACRLWVVDQLRRLRTRASIMAELEEMAVYERRESGRGQ